jgi:hypothetical protein
MNDEEIEKLLRELPAGELPVEWRGSILRTARRDGRRPVQPNSRNLFSALLLVLRGNPLTAGGLAILWIVIVILKTGTPADPVADRLLARTDYAPPPNFQPRQEEELLARLLDDDAGPAPLREP